MDSFLQTFAVVMALVLGIALLSLFFWFLIRASRFLDRGKISPLPGYGRKLGFVNVHLLDGSVLENVKMLGVAHQGSRPNPIPRGLAQMLVLENAQGLKTYVQAHTVKMIRDVAAT